MKLLLWLFIFTISITSFADDVEERRQKIIEIIDEEINEIDRLSSQQQNSPQFLLRKAELNLEKARLWREKENADYLALKENVRRKVNKNNYFKKSNLYFNSANKLCLLLIRKYPRYSSIGDAYYILGYNAKEANNQKQAARYLNSAKSKTRDPKTKIRTQITLAEVYYNEKKYSRAVPLYEQALKTKQDKWWTKDAFNLGWSYYQIGNISKAISTMEEVYSLSENPKYIDMRRDVARDIGLFYATSGRIDQGIRFFQKRDEDFSKKLLGIAIVLQQQGQFLKAKSVLSYALKYAKNEEQKIEIHMSLLELYERGNQMQSHQKTVNTLFKYYKNDQLSKDQLSVYKFQLEKVSANLQRQVISKTYKRVLKVRQAKANQALDYFEKLSRIDDKKRAEYKYLKAETAFVVGYTTSAFNFYKETFEVSKEGEKFKRLSMDGMLAALGAMKQQSYASNVYVFEAYLKNWPNDSKSQSIYTRLFNNYMGAKKYDKARSVLDRYKQYYKKDYKTQEAMIAQLMDEDRKKGNNGAIRDWISAIKAGEYSVSNKYLIKLQELLTTLQIEDVQKELGKGNKKVALVGYHNILKDPFSTKKSKINAKYNLSALYFELNDPINAYKWSVEALKEMETKDVINFSTSFITIANYLFSSLEFARSATLSEYYIAKICSTKYRKKNTSFKNAVFIYLAEGDIEKAEKMISVGKQCRISDNDLNLAKFELMRELKSKKRYEEYEKYVAELVKTKKYTSRMIDEYLFLKNLYYNLGETQKAQGYLNYAWKLYYNAKKGNDSISMSSLDYFAEVLLENMKKTQNDIAKLKLSFPEATFQKILGDKFKLLETLIAQASKVQEVGSGVGIVNSYQVLYDVHLNLSKEVFEFIPPDKTKEYIAAFKKDINGSVGERLKQSAFFYRKEAKKAINKNEILNVNNFAFQDGEKPIKYYGQEASLIMDRGGR